MKCAHIALLILCATSMALLAQSEKKSGRPIKPGDITKAIDAFIATDDKDTFSKKYLVPIFHATAAVMEKQLPEAPALAAEMAQSLYVIYDYPNKELTDTAARAFLIRPDLFNAAFESINEDERPKAVAAIVPPWGELADKLEGNPKTDATVRVRIKALDNMVRSWKAKYPQYVPKRWL